MESRHWRFALCGSSARQLRKAGVNLLAGRALTFAMAPFSAAELGPQFDLARALEWGLLPVVQTDPGYAVASLRAYVDTYLKEEIRQEGVVRNLPPFLRFLALAGQLNGQVVNGQNLARDVGIGRSTVDAYFSILTDTMLGFLLPAWQPRIKVRERAHPKFYWFDAGVARAAAGLLDDRPERAWLGTALETYLLHECRVRNAVSGQARGLYYYGLAAGGEIDLIIETRRPQSTAPTRVVAVEIKLSEKWDRNNERALRDLAASGRVEVERMIGVYTGTRVYRFEGLDVLPVDEFVKELHAGKVF
jgi:predicted AAA+ superfamily ATPase